MTTTGSDLGTKSVRNARRAATAAFIGGALEYYDFFVYAASAALVFGEIFFADPSTTGTLLSFATLGVAYIARPIGALVLGNFGDRLGRKTMLVLTLIVMGGSTFLIGCLPTYGQIGVGAPVLVVILRLIQGFSAGGEAPGAQALVVEIAPENRRGFYGSFIQTGIIAGFIMSSLVLIPIAALPHESLVSWGWRIPFWASALMLIVGIIIRTKLAEPVVFEVLKEKEAVEKFPVAAVIRLQWTGILRLVFACMFQAVFTFMTTLGLSYAANVVKLPSSTILVALVIAAAIMIVSNSIGGRLSDTFGRRPIAVITIVATILGIFFYFFALSQSNVPLIFVAAIFMGLAYFGNGVAPALFAEMFETRVRYSGAAIGMQLGQLIIGFSPLIGAALLAGKVENWPLIAGFSALFSVVAGIAILLGPETAKTPMGQLGNRRARLRAEKALAEAEREAASTSGAPTQSSVA